MKIQCACGAKFSFDITPDMATASVQFVCPNCGLNSTSLVNHLIHQHAIGALPKPGGRATTILPGPVATAPATSAPRVPVAKLLSSSPTQPTAVPAAAVVTAPAPVVRVAVPDRTAASSTPSDPSTASAPQLCTKHVWEVVTNRCVVCQKPICLQCMALFGWVCSPLCRRNGERQGIAIPEYEGMKFETERKEWRKIARAASALIGGVALVLGLWFWYAWFGSAPKLKFSAGLPEAATSGQLYAGPQKQFIILHGGRLLRHDGNARREVWSVPLIDKQTISDESVVSHKLLIAGRREAINQGADLDDFQLPMLEEVIKDRMEFATAELRLHVVGNNIWVESPEKLVRYDWDTGKAIKEIAHGEDSGELSRLGNEFLLLSQNETSSEITRINLATGESHAQTVARPTELLATGGDPSARSATNAARAGAFTNLLARAGVSSNLLARAGLLPGAGDLDPQAIARNIQNMPLANRLALPAVLAAAGNQQRLKNALNDFDPNVLASLLGGLDFAEEGGSRLIPTRDGYLQFTSELIEHRTVARKVMKDPPAKSALDGPINQAATAAIANEILNEIARENIGDTVEEDESRYLVTVQRPGAPDWSGEVIGPADLIPLDTVNLVVAGKSVVVLDKNNKKLWEAKLAANVNHDSFDVFDVANRFGAGPAVEQGDTLYIFDSAMLTSFERATGNASWRLPSVNIQGLFFDDDGMIYINTSTASPDSLRFSRQINISDKTHALVIKVDPKTGKSLWRTENDGLVAYVSGKYIYTVESSRGEAAGSLLGTRLGPAIPPHILIKRLKPSNGRVLWEHHEMRGPLDYHFDRNEIQILFGKELQVLRFWSL